MLKELLKINLFYANPIFTRGVIKKYKSDKNLYKKIIFRGYIFPIILFLLLFTIMVVDTDFKNNPYFFDFLLLFFILTSLFQTFINMYNVMVKNGENEIYKSLPLKEKEIYFSRIIILIPLLLQFLLPILSVFFVFYFQNEFNIIYNIVFSILNFISLFILILSIFSFMIIYIKKIGLSDKMINILNIFFMLVGTVFTIGLLKMTEVKVVVENKVYGPLSSIDLNTIINISFILIAIIISYQLFNLSYNKYSLSYNIELKSKIVNKKNSKMNIRKYIFNQIKDATLIYQSVATPIAMSILFFASLLVDYKKFYFIKDYPFILSLIIGIYFSFVFTAYPSSLSLISLSIEKENFNFIKSLPINFRQFILNKVLVTTLIFIIPNTLIFLIISLVYGILMKYVLLETIIFTILCYSKSINNVIYDYENINLLWNNLTELTERGGKFYLVLKLTLMIFVIPIIVTPLIIYEYYQLQGNFIYYIYLFLIVVYLSFKMVKFDKFCEKYKI
ncbi:hypothetical protein [Streptobacillus canis]|uniref:hypothetical protein n=1 Tax=Streptobacillus canis TaxID=2678686 RepID=UPI0012E1B5EA|nr:hypothetical protein [Streptobacillus canis]